MKILYTVGIAVLAAVVFAGVSLPKRNPILVAYEDLIPSTRKQVDCLAENIYYEAGVESDQGKLAVALVTLNRVKSEQFPKTICGVVKERNERTCQFSWYCEPKKQINKSVYNRSREIALYTYLNYEFIKDITYGSTFYHATYVSPGWKNVRKTVQIGQHIFYKERL